MLSTDEGFDRCYPRNSSKTIPIFPPSSVFPIPPYNSNNSNITLLAASILGCLCLQPASPLTLLCPCSQAARRTLEDAAGPVHVIRKGRLNHPPRAQLDLTLADVSYLHSTLCPRHGHHPRPPCGFLTPWIHPVPVHSLLPAQAGPPQ